MLRKILSFLICFVFLFEQLGFTQVLPAPSPAFSLPAGLVDTKFRPLHLRYLELDSATNNLNLLLDKGDTKELSRPALEGATNQLLDYFRIGLTLPNSAFWVNLRPDSSENIIDPNLAKTDVGKILLEADVQLKKDTALFTSPSTLQGKEYWDKLYRKAEELFGTGNMSVPTLTRTWIVPNEIIVRETNGSTSLSTRDSAYIYKATLKVLLEQDYLKGKLQYTFADPRAKILNEYASELMRKLIIPALTKDVNTAKRYAPLRQVYYSLILAQWFKAKGLSSQMKGAVPISKASWQPATYYQQYKLSTEKGEYDLSETTGTGYYQTQKRYFAGGILLGLASKGITSVKAFGKPPANPANLPVVYGNGKITKEPAPPATARDAEGTHPPASSATDVNLAVGAQEAAGTFDGQLNPENLEIRELTLKDVEDMKKVEGDFIVAKPEGVKWLGIYYQGELIGYTKYDLALNLHYDIIIHEDYRKLEAGRLLFYAELLDVARHGNGGTFLSATDIVPKIKGFWKSIIADENLGVIDTDSLSFKIERLPELEVINSILGRTTGIEVEIPNGAIKGENAVKVKQSKPLDTRAVERADQVKAILLDETRRPEPEVVAELSEQDIRQGARQAGYTEREVDRVLGSKTFRELENALPYVKEIAEQVLGRGYDRILVAARDGEIFYDALKILSAGTPAEGKVMFFPGSEALLGSFYSSKTKHEDVREFLDSFGLTPGNIKKEKILVLDTGFGGSVGTKIKIAVSQFYPGSINRQEIDKAIDIGLVSTDPLLAGSAGTELVRFRNFKDDTSLEEVFPKTSAAVDAGRNLNTNYVLAVALQLLPRYHGHFVKLERADGRLITVTQQEDEAADIDFTGHINASIVYPLAAMLVQKRVVEYFRKGQGPDAPVRQLRDHLKQVEDTMKRKGYVTAGVTNKERSGERLVNFFNGIAGITKKAGGVKQFDSVFYPGSGSDIITPTRFARRIITISHDDIFSIPGNFIDEDVLVDDLENKFSAGMHAAYFARTFTNYVAELVLLGVDPESFNIVEDVRIAGGTRMVTVGFRIDGEEYTHTHFTYDIKGDFDAAEPGDRFVKEKMPALLKGKIAVIVKASSLGRKGQGRPMLTRAFYHFFPEGTVILSDEDEQVVLKESGVRANLKDLRTQGIIDDLEELQRGAENSPGRMVFGYKGDIRELTIAQLYGSEEPNKGNSTGGIDFRSLPIAAQPVGFRDGPQKEGIAPVVTSIRVSFQKDPSEENISLLLAQIADILRQEERCRRSRSLISQT